MAQTPEIQAPQAGTIVAVNQVAQALRVPQGISLGIYNVPADNIAATYAGENVTYRRTAQTIRVTQLAPLAVYRGKIDNPKLKSWFYTLDGHDFYILKLGTGGKTLVLDLMTGQWSWWTTGNDLRWRASVGMNWRSSGNIPEQFGSNVVVGDDSYGVLWILDPEKGQDDMLLTDAETTFPRVATGQMVSRGRISLPIYSVYLTASLGDPALTLNNVTLEYSDDQGHSYVTADQPQTTQEGSYDQEFVWRSLGQVRAPGRLFRITDNGAFRRIDSLDVNANEGA